MKTELFQKVYGNEMADNKFTKSSGFSKLLPLVDL